MGTYSDSGIVFPQDVRVIEWRLARVDTEDEAASTIRCNKSVLSCNTVQPEREVSTASVEAVEY